MRGAVQCFVCSLLLALVACGKPEADRPAAPAAASGTSAPANALALLEGAPAGASQTETGYVASGLRTESTMRVESIYLPPRAQATPAPVLSERVKFKVGSTTASAHYFQLQGAQPTVGIVALHPRSGLTPAVLREAEQLAQLNCAVLALDYYNGVVPASVPDALRLATQFGGAVAQQQIVAAQAWLRQTHQTSHLIVLGWGDGGALALAAGLASPAPEAVVTYYGDLPGQFTTVTQQLARNQVAVLGFFAKRDAWVTPARVNAFDEALSQAGVDHLFSSYVVEPDFVFDSNAASQAYAGTARNTLRDFLTRRGIHF